MWHYTFQKWPKNRVIDGARADVARATVEDGLDGALNRLAARDRDAIVLRFLQQQSFAEVSQSLGVPEDTAKKRVARALQKLRRLFLRDGIMLSLAALPASLDAIHAVQAPAGFAAATTTAAFSVAASSTAISHILAQGVIKAMAISKLVLALSVGGPVLLLAACLAAPRFLAPTAPVTDAPLSSTAAVAQTGILDFRIALIPSDAAADLVNARDSLATKGPATAVKVSGVAARWFEIHPDGMDNFTRGGYVLSTRAGASYILCYDDHDHTLTHADSLRKPWQVSALMPYSDASGSVELPFKLDVTGARYMGDLTGANKRQPLTMLLDDRAISAPVIQSQITDSGVITFGTPTASHPAAAIEIEAQRIKQAMDAATHPAAARPAP